MRKVMGFISGTLLLVSGFFHSFTGLPRLTDALTQEGVPGNIHLAVIAGWTFGAAAMIAFGVMMLIWAVRHHRGESPSSAPAGVISVMHFVYGAIVYYIADFNPHYLLFILIGVSTGLTVNWRRLLPEKA